MPHAVLSVRNLLPFFIVLWLNSRHHWCDLNIRASSCSEEVLWILGTCFHSSFRHILHICKMVTLFSVCQGNGSGVWTPLVLVTILLVFPYFLFLPWMCLFYCFLNLDIAFYLDKQKPLHAFFPPLSLDGSLRAYLPKNVPLGWFSWSNTVHKYGFNYLM